MSPAFLLLPLAVILMFVPVGPIETLVLDNCTATPTGAWMASVALTVVPSVDLRATGVGNCFLPTGANKKPTFFGLRLLFTMMLIAMDKPPYKWGRDA